MAAPINVKIVGNALNSQGLTGEDTIAGLGLNTFGFLWPVASIWTDCEESITTTWIDCTNCSEDC